MRDSLIFYRSFYEAIKELPKETQAEVYTAIFEYSLNFNEVQLSGLAKTIFTLIKPQLEANNKRFINGSKAKIKQDKSETEAKPKQKESKTEANNNNNNNNNVNKNNNISLEKKQIPKKVFFKDSEFIKKELFRNALPDWSVEKLRYYYDALLTWSNEGNKKVWKFSGVTPRFRRICVTGGKIRNVWPAVFTSGEYGLIFHFFLIHSHFLYGSDT
jgi:hypothetical protein